MEHEELVEQVKKSLVARPEGVGPITATIFQALQSVESLDPEDAEQVLSQILFCDACAVAFLTGRTPTEVLQDAASNTIANNIEQIWPKVKEALNDLIGEAAQAKHTAASSIVEATAEVV